MGNSYIGEFEQMVLLAMLQQGEKAYAIDVRRELERCAGRSVSRGALYRTFDRLEQKGYVYWALEDGSPVPDRGGHGVRAEDVIDELTAVGFEQVSGFEDWQGERGSFCLVFRR